MIYRRAGKVAEQQRGSDVSVCRHINQSHFSMPFFNIRIKLWAGIWHDCRSIHFLFNFFSIAS